MKKIDFVRSFRFSKKKKKEILKEQTKIPTNDFINIDLGFQTDRKASLSICDMEQS